MLQKINVYLGGLFLTMFSALALAEGETASVVPAGVLSALTDGITDTFADIMAWVWAIFPIIALGWFAFNQARKGSGKFGAR